MFYITKQFSLDMGHVLSDPYSHECKNLHGHTYHVKLTISRKDLNNSVVIDFKKLKELFDTLIKTEFDHKFLVPKCLYNEIFQANNVLCVPYEPTAENLAKVFFDIMHPELTNEGCRLCSVEVQEGDNNVGGYCLE